MAVYDWAVDVWSRYGNVEGWDVIVDKFKRTTEIRNTCLQISIKFKRQGKTETTDTEPGLMKDHRIEKEDHKLFEDELKWLEEECATQNAIGRPEKVGLWTW
ncbi:hypothetical protein PIB30_051070 [Stylosanthes scabra]|uniref:Uncharacterized protein n=1 Tax=Stylosanthes scabra TaxID=79078 RepID=A0ABU6WHU5_9FABA|nr:hypothetical protein [Stylosanthes scabra]